MFALLSKLFQNPEPDMGQSCNPNGDNSVDYPNTTDSVNCGLLGL